MLQVVGSLLAIPVGLASAYSIYRANFSADTTCQTLRANIVSMLDKSVDAGTRRMLVRRDVEKLRANLRRDRSGRDGGVQDIAGRRQAPAGADCRAGRAQRADAPPKRAVRKIEPHSQVAAKAPAAAWPIARRPDGATIQPCPTRSGSTRFARLW